MLKEPHRRKTTRRRVENDFREASLGGPLAQFSRAGLTDAQAGAFQWLSLVYGYLDLARGPFQDRVASLNCDSLLEDPTGVLTRICQFMDLRPTSGEIQRIVQGPLFLKYSKPSRSSSSAFTADTRRAELDRAAHQYKDEIQDGLEWAKQILERHPISDFLPLPLS
jgi:hypothetical protein